MSRLDKRIQSNPMLLDIINLWIDDIISERALLAGLLDGGGVNNLEAMDIIAEAKEYKKAKRHIPNFITLPKQERNYSSGNEISMADWVIDEKGVGHWEEKP